MRAIIETDKMSINMLNFAGFLDLQFNVPFDQAMKGFAEICLQYKECTYILVYMLRHYPNQQNAINSMVC